MREKLLMMIAALILLLEIAHAESGIVSKAQLNESGRKIGIGQGSAAEDAVMSELPKAEIAYFTDNLLGYTAVAQGKIDAYVYDRVQMQLTIDNGLTGMRLLPEVMDQTVRIAVGYSGTSTIPNLQDRLNGFISEAKADGTLDDMYRRWVLEGNRVMPEIPRAEKPKMGLHVGITGSVPPYSYYEGGGLTGYDIELARRFASWLGAKLSLEIYDFDGIVPAAKAGKIDVIMSNLQYLPERSDGLPFSDILYEERLGIMVRGGDSAAADPLPTGEGTLADLNGKRIGVQTGASFDAMVAEKLPEAQVEYYNGKADLLAALTGHKIGAFVVDEAVAQILTRESDQVTWLPEYLDSYEFALVFPKGEAGERLRDQFNTFLEQLPEGELDRLADKWFGEDEAAKTMPNLAALKAENGTLRLATESGYAPFEYVRDGAVVGYDMELAALFCEYGGYGLEIVDMNFDGILPAVQAHKCDFAAAGISITPERAESVLFSEPTFSGGTVAVVLRDRAEAPAASGAHWQDYNGKRLGVLVGPLMEDAAKAYFPDSEILLLDSYPDCVMALLTGKIDAFLGDEPEIKCMRMEQPEIDYIPERLSQNNYCFAFRKNDPESAALRAELNDFIARCRADGTLQALDDIWFGTDEDRKIVDMSDLAGKNGTIRVVTTSMDMPFSYIKDGMNVGYDIDLVVRFCRDRGYALKLGDVDFAGRIPAVESGKFDFSTDMNATPERMEQVLFSEPTSYGGIVLAVKGNAPEASQATDQSAGTETGAAKKASFWEGVKASFQRTFIRENRWQLFAQGVLTTLLITVLTILFGTALGFAVFMLCRNGNPAANLVTRFCLWLVQGMRHTVEKYGGSLVAAQREGWFELKILIPMDGR